MREPSPPSTAMETFCSSHFFSCLDESFYCGLADRTCDIADAHLDQGRTRILFHILTYPLRNLGKEVRLFDVLVVLVDMHFLLPPIFSHFDLAGEADHRGSRHEYTLICIVDHEFAAV